MFPAVPRIDAAAPAVRRAPPQPPRKRRAASARGVFDAARSGKGPEGDELDERVDRRHERDLRDERERHVALRIAVLARRRGRVLEAGVGEEEEERHLAEPGRVDARGSHDPLPLHREEAGADEERERDELGHEEEGGGSRTVLHSPDVDRRQDEERDRDERRPHPPVARGGPRPGERLREAGRERGERRDAGEEGHPADLEPGQVAPRLAGVDVGAPRLVEAARRLGEAEDDEEDREPREGDAPEARRPGQNRRRGGGEEVDAAPDDVVQREGDDLGPRDDALRFRPVHVSCRAIPRSRRASRGRCPSARRSPPSPRSSRSARERGRRISARSGGSGHWRRRRGC